jgi:hypothetical protein
MAKKRKKDKPPEVYDMILRLDVIVGNDFPLNLDAERISIQWKGVN